jgi:hypothetical protein
VTVSAALACGIEIMAGINNAALTNNLRNILDLKVTERPDKEYERVF